MLKFSVIIPCYHSEDFIEKAIQSVQEQSFKNYELLVMCEKDDYASIGAVRRCGVEPIIDDYGSSGAAIFGIHGFTPVCGNNGAMYPNVWSRVWRKAFLDRNDIRFPNTSRDEDVVFCQKAFGVESAHRMTDIPFIYYTYPREGSRMNERERDNVPG